MAATHIAGAPATSSLLLDVATGHPAAVDFGPVKAKPILDARDLLVFLFPGFRLNRQPQQHEMRRAA